MKRLFGTDGIRAVAGDYPLDPLTVYRLGRALGESLRSPGTPSPRVLIGRDTRESGPLIESALIAGLTDGGATGESIGVVTTPAISYLTREGGYSAGAMISASHNPFHDNGIKVLGPDGMKLADVREAALEELILDRPQNGEPARAERLPELLAPPDAGRIAKYTGHLAEACGGPGSLAGMKLVLDCARGSAYGIAPALFESLGASVHPLGCDPTGRNINEACGSLHLDHLRDEVLRVGADLGLAFDGDADRCLAVDRTGRHLDGDFILYVQALRLKRAGALRRDLVVATVMSNLWLEKALEVEGIQLLRTQVGDKYVLERMIEQDASLGGEQSGHVIFLDHSPTGDGILTGLLMAAAENENGTDLARIAEGIRPCPQVLINVKVSAKPVFSDHPTIGPALRRTEEQLAGSGRVLLRYSGTEPLARVMIEGFEDGLVRQLADELAGLIRREIGA